MMAWYDENPAWYNQEIESLENEGFKYVINESALSTGRLIITVTYHLNGVSHDLTCLYPPSYPFFPPTVKCRTLPAGRHVCPYTGTVCLFENAQSVWHTKDTLASVLKSQLPKLILEHESEQKPEDIEGVDGYQISGQIPYEPYSVIFTDDWNIPKTANFGEFRLRYNTNVSSGSTLCGYVKTFNCDGHKHRSSTQFLEQAFDSETICRWVKLDAPPSSKAPDQILDEVSKIKPDIRNFLLPNKSEDIIGLAFEEESSKGLKVLNWIFIIRRKIKSKKTKSGKTAYEASIIRSDRLSNDNIQKRVPRLKSLVEKNILVIGAGALGSQVIWQLARAGIKNITIIDHDIVQAGNIPRWLLGFSAIGKPKVEAINSFLKENYPDILCKPLGFSIGGQFFKNPVGTKLIDPHKTFIKLIEKMDLVIDCTAEQNINNYVSTYTKKSSKPYVWATATQGGWGGIIGRISPEMTADWLDFANLNKSDYIRSPAAEEGSDIQPVGCFHPTFTGTGFDLDHVSLMATRLAVSTLCRGIDGGYPDFDWDVCVLNLWDEATGLPIAPQWFPHTLKKYSGG